MFLSVSTPSTGACGAAICPMLSSLDALHVRSGKPSRTESITSLRASNPPPARLLLPAALLEYRNGNLQEAFSMCSKALEVRLNSCYILTSCIYEVYILSTVLVRCISSEPIQARVDEPAPPVVGKLLECRRTNDA